MTLEERQARKLTDERYREAAVRLSGGTVRHMVAVNRTIDDDGAFVEVIMWVPKEEIGDLPDDGTGRQLAIPVE